MTTATKLNSTKLLSQLASSQSSGCLEVNEGEIYWKIYLQQGNLQYVYCSIQLLDQLKYHLYYLGWKQAVAALKNCPQSLLKIQDKSSEQNIYSQLISWLLAEKHLNPAQGALLIQSISKDELYSCLWLDQGTSTWQDGDLLPHWILSPVKDSLSLSISECLSEAQTRLEQWQNCSTELVSVHQRPYFPPSWSTKSLPPGSLNHQALTELTQVLRGRTSIRQLSVLLKKDELQVAQILSPYIDEKIIYLHHAQSPLNQLPAIPKVKSSSSQAKISSSPAQSKVAVTPVETKTWKIVCIDDSPTILNEIKRFLDQEKFEITAIDDPVKAVSQIFTIKPDLILLDITMPRINGYKLCGLLRNSGKCDDTPIIMVTGNTGLIDKARAKISGATDYFTKPFTKQGLTRIVEKHLK